MIEDFRETLIELIPPTILWMIFLVTISVFIIISVALMYHWKNYNTNSAVSKRIMKIYFLISGSFLFAMLVAAIAYST